MMLSISFALARSIASGLLRFRYSASIFPRPSASIDRSARTLSLREKDGFSAGADMRLCRADSCRRRRTGGLRHDFKAAFGDEHGVFPLRRQAVVLGDDGPTVGEFTNAGFAGV